MLTEGDGALPTGRVVRVLRRLVLVVVAVQVGGIGSTVLRRAPLVGAAGAGVGLAVVVFVGADRVAARRRVEKAPDAAIAAADEFSSGPDPSDVEASDILCCVGVSLTRVLNGAEMNAVPMAVQAGSQLVELFWNDRPPRPSGEWSAAPAGWVWLARRSDVVERSQVGLQDLSAVPGWVRVGTTVRGDLALNLEAFATVSLSGDELDVTRFGVGLVNELNADAVDVVLIESLRSADLPIDVAAVRRWSVGDLHGEVRRRGEKRARLLEERRWPSAFAARLHDPDPDAWRPLVVFVVGDEDAAACAELGSADLGVTCVFIGDTQAELQLEVRSDHIRVPFLGELEITIPDLGAPEPSEDGEARRAIEDHADAQETTTGLEVCVLGPVEVRDAPGELTAKSLELAAYLACHPEGVPDDRIKAALWPDRAPQPQTWMNRVWSCRKALGVFPDGAFVLPHFEGHSGRLDPRVRTDVDVVATACTDADGLVGVDAMGVLAAALRRVRGRPFEESSGYEWAYAEQHVSQAERVVTEAAHRLVELALAAGDETRALWATEQALRACPASEPVALDRMRAFYAAGDLAGVETTMRDLLASLDEDDPEMVLHSDTLALFAEMTGERSGPRDRMRPRSSGGV